MSESRNDYPRLCWSCLKEIATEEEDTSLTDCGGYCTSCSQQQRGDMPRLRELLKGQHTRMNSAEERDSILQELTLFLASSAKRDNVNCEHVKLDVHSLATGDVRVVCPDCHETALIEALTIADRTLKQALNIIAIEFGRIIEKRE